MLIHRKLVTFALLLLVHCKGTTTQDLLDLAFLGTPTIDWRTPAQGGDGVATNADIYFSASQGLDVDSANQRAVLRSLTSGATVPVQIKSTGTNNNYVAILTQPLTLRNSYTFTIPAGTKTSARSFQTDQVLRFSTVPNLQPVASSFGAATDGIGTFVLAEGTTTYQASITFGKEVTGVALATNSVEITTASGCMPCMSLSNLSGSGAGPYTFAISGLLSAATYTLKFGSSIRDTSGTFAASSITFSVAPVISGVRNWGGRGIAGDAGGGSWYADLTAPVVTTDGAGNTYAAGRFIGTANWGGGNRTSATPALYVVKTDTSGNYLWDRFFSATNVIMPQAIAADSLGVYVTGMWEAGTLAFDSFPLAAAGGADTFLVKLSASNGTAMWSNRVSNNGSNQDFPSNMKISPDGNLFFSASSYVAWNVVPFSSAGPCGNPGTINFLASIDSSNGTCRWILNSSVFSLADFAFDATNGYVYLSGSYSGTAASFLFNGAGLQIASAQIGGNSDIYVARIGYNGGSTPVYTTGGGNWIGRVGSSNYDFANGIAIDVANDRVYVVGQVQGSVNMGCTVTPCTSVGSAGSVDGFVAAFPLAGTAPLWANTIGGTAGTDKAVRVTVFNGRARVFSFYELTIGNLKTNQFGCAFNNLSGFGYQDLLLTMYDSSGTLMGTRLMGSPYNEESRYVVNNVWQDSSGKLTVGLHMGPGVIDTTTITSSNNPTDLVLWQMQ